MSALIYLVSGRRDSRSPMKGVLMSWMESSPLAQALRAVLLYLWYLGRLRELSAQGALDGDAGLALMGWQILLLIGVTIAIGILIQIICVILTTATGQESAADLEDERDKVIEARATVTGFSLAGIGFVAAVLALWQGWGAVWAFNLVLAGMVASDLAVNLLKFLRYWRGG